MATELLEIASLNLLRDQTWSRPVADLSKVIRRWRPAFIGCQEGQDYIGALRDGVEGYRLALPPGARGGARNNPVMYDPDQVRYLGAASHRMHDGRKGLFPPRYDSEYRFQWEADGSVIIEHNTHVNSHIEKGGRPRDLPRVGMSIRHLRKLADNVAQDARGHRLGFLTGDLNVDEDADNRVDFSGFPNQVFREYKIESIYDELGTPASFDTKGRRKIDVIASYKGDRRVTGEKVEKIDAKALHSDHAAVCATYRVRLRAA